MVTKLLSFLLTVSFTTLFAQIPNSGFENWTVDANNDNNPNGWETTNSDPDISVDPYTPAYAGSFSMRVKTFDPGFMAIPGFAMAEFPFTLRPTCFTVCFKSTIMPGDGAYIIFSLWSGDSIIAAPGDCTFHIDSNYAAFTCLTFPIYYQSSLTPDSANIMIVAGTVAAQIGTELIVDELSFNCSTSIQDEKNNSGTVGQIYPNPSSHITYIPIQLFESKCLDVFIYDMQGKLIKTIQYGVMDAGEHSLTIPVGDLANGLYHYSLQGLGQLLNGKFQVQN